MDDRADELNKLKKRLKVFEDLARTLTSRLEPREVLQAIMAKVQELLTPQNWSLLLVDSEGENLRFEMAFGEGSEVLLGGTLRMGEGIAGSVAVSGEPVLISDVRSDPRFAQKFDHMTSFETRSIICVPMKAGDRAVGVIELINMMDGQLFDEDDMYALATIAEYGAIALENANSYKKIQRLVISDEHTTLFNARHLHESLDRGLEAALGDGSKLSLIFLDLDHFKSINDTWGYQAGSKLLREVGLLLRSSVRSGDIPVRYGGDEFIIILPGTPKEEAISFAREIRNKLNYNDFLKSDGLRVNLTASFGVATFPDDARTKDELLSKSDTAMYDVKESGRDSVKGA
jgi:diguanylate cyclase (GGDEF)-like protein